ncbi:MAG: GNAT family N-acetyltransferase [Gammaproteobacteria bacterium]|nr:GNAT family N-acetyltransferase [Gammaproteobacteria bacterium]
MIIRPFQPADRKAVEAGHRGWINYLATSPAPAALRYRAATEADVEWLLALRRSTMDPHLRASGTEPREDAHREAVLADFESARIILLGADEVGMIKLVRDDPEWHLRHIQIAPEFQRRGIGQAVIHEMLGEARAMSASIVLNVLKVNPAKNLYERLGFRVVEEDDRAFRMRWSGQ